MTEIPNEEHLDSPINTDIENLSDIVVADIKVDIENKIQSAENLEKLSEIDITDSDNEIDTPNQKTENMEVHHHKHKHHEEKRLWGSYFWEFLMLFLAVFCGTLAEYGLDHKIENDREKEFIETMISDLKEDTTLLGQSIIKFKQKGTELDSLTILLNSSNIKTHGSELYYYGRLASRFDFFTSTDRTIQQMKNSGAFRLIRKNNAASNILQYYSEMNGVYLFQNNTNELALEYRSLAYTLFNPEVFESIVNDETKNAISKPFGNPSLMSYDKSAIVRFSSTLHYMKGSRMVLYDRYIYLNKKATALIELLNKEYHLE